VLRVDGYSGTAGDSLQYHDNQPFTTLDRLCLCSSLMMESSAQPSSTSTALFQYARE